MLGRQRWREREEVMVCKIPYIDYTYLWSCGCFRGWSGLGRTAVYMYMLHACVYINVGSWVTRTHAHVP